MLHHTIDARQAFSELVRFLKPGGFILVGLYHKFGRIVTKFKQMVAPIIGKNLNLIDSTLRNLKNEEKAYAWEKDQFYNPLETVHTLSEVFSWIDENKLEYVNSIPFNREGIRYLFQKQKKPHGLILKMQEVSLALDLSQIKEGGFFIFVSRKPSII